MGRSRFRGREAAGVLILAWGITLLTSHEIIAAIFVYDYRTCFAHVEYIE